MQLMFFAFVYIFIGMGLTDKLFSYDADTTFKQWLFTLLWPIPLLGHAVMFIIKGSKCN